MILFDQELIINERPARIIVQRGPGEEPGLAACQSSAA